MVSWSSFGVQSAVILVSKLNLSSPGAINANYTHNNVTIPIFVWQGIDDGGRGAPAQMVEDSYKTYLHAVRTLTRIVQ